MKIKIFSLLVIPLMLFACKGEPAHEDVALMELVAIEQLQKNNDAVQAMRNNLEFYGAPSGEEKYYEKSGEIRELRDKLIQKVAAKDLLAYNDSLSAIYDEIGSSNEYQGNESWNEYDERLRVFYEKQVKEDFDSLAYYKFLYITLKKEYALHLLNMQMMGHN